MRRRFSHSFSCSLSSDRWMQPNTFLCVLRQPFLLATDVVHQIKSNFYKHFPCMLYVFCWKTYMLRSLPYPFKGFSRHFSCFYSKEVKQRPYTIRARVPFSLSLHIIYSFTPKIWMTSLTKDCFFLSLFSLLSNRDNTFALFLWPSIQQDIKNWLLPHFA